MEKFDLENRKIDQYMDRVDNHLNEIKTISESIFCNLDYINWLVHFTLMYNDFADDSWLYNQDDLEENDCRNVLHLSNFFYGIEKYARNNYVYPIIDNGTNYYKIKYNGVGFLIGVIHGQDIITYCSRVLMENEDEFIDFEDIVNNRKQKNVPMIEANLQALNDDIDVAYQNGTPIKAISDLINNKLKNMAYHEYIESKKEKNHK